MISRVLIRTTPVLFAVGIACTRDTTPPEPAVATSVQVAPATLTMSELETRQFVATVRDQRGQVLTGAAVTWTSSLPDFVPIDSNGLATTPAFFPGTFDPPPVTISATVGSLTGKATLLLLRRGVFSAWPDTNVLYVGMTRALRPRIVKNLRGYPGGSLQEAIPSAAVVWSTNDASVVTVDDTGLVTTIASGHARVTASYQNRTASAEVYVSTPPATPLRFTSFSSIDVKVGESKPYEARQARGCGVTRTGSVYCWGAGIDMTGITDRCEQTTGGAGGYTTYRYRCSEIPVRLQTDVPFTALNADGSCGLATSKRVYCWAANMTGVAPIASSDDFMALAGRTCGIRTDGALLCWGGGIGATPRAVEGGVTWRAIADAGGCGLAADSTAYCFATGTAQRVGGTTRWKSIATGNRGGGEPLCALAVDDAVFCGSNLQKQVTPTPSVASLGTYWTSIRSDFLADVCGVGASGEIGCASEFTQIGWTPQNPGVKLKRFYGHCGIATDDKLYCAGADFSRSGFAPVPGQ